MNPDLLFRLALTEVPNVGCVQAKILTQHFETAEKIFKAKPSSLEKIEGIGTIRANNIKRFIDFSKAEKEIEFIEKFKNELSPDNRATVMNFSLAKVRFARKDFAMALKAIFTKRLKFFPAS